MTDAVPTNIVAALGALESWYAAVIDDQGTMYWENDRLKELRAALNIAIVKALNEAEERAEERVDAAHACAPY
jgi:hypothetical protein